MGGKDFQCLGSRLQMRLRGADLIIHLIRKGTPPEVEFNIFARINIGGISLSPQELRHAITPGNSLAAIAHHADALLALLAPTIAHGAELCLVQEGKLLHSLRKPGLPSLFRYAGAPIVAGMAYSNQPALNIRRKPPEPSRVSAVTVRTSAATTRVCSVSHDVCR